MVDQVHWQNEVRNASPSVDWNIPFRAGVMPNQAVWQVRYDATSGRITCSLISTPRLYSALSALSQAS